MSFKESVDRILLIDEWDENTEIDWWNENRKKLNSLIRAFNDWQTADNFNSETGVILYARAKHLLHTLKKGNYEDDLNKMMEHIKKNTDD